MPKWERYAGGGSNQRIRYEARLDRSGTRIGYCTGFVYPDDESPFWIWRSGFPDTKDEGWSRTEAQAKREAMRSCGRQLREARKMEALRATMPAPRGKRRR